MKITTRFAVSDIPLSGAYCNDHLFNDPVDDEGAVYVTRHSFLGVQVLGKVSSEPCQHKRANGRPCGHKGYVRMREIGDLCRAHTNAEWRRWRESASKGGSGRRVRTPSA